jgi:hypothetical protein
MRTVNWVRVCAFAGVLATFVGAALPSQAASGCSTLNVTFNRVLAVPLNLPPTLDHLG